MTSESGFQARCAAALGDQELRGNFRRAMDGLMAKRAAAFPDPEERERLRDVGEDIRRRCLGLLPYLLEQLEENCERNGIQVHWAETTDEANAIVLEILQKRGAKRLVKGKSMVSEEMGLNHFLEGHGIECVESDLGEYIVQLAEETPSHIIMPAIHQNKSQIAKLFREKIKGAKKTEEVDELTAMAREALRRKFFEADAGLSGVNMAVAESGALVLVENEGNGRMSTTVPPLHIAVTGIDKVVQRLEEVPPLLSLLTRSATGQPITTYVNVISSPRKPGEKDGPEEVHLVLLDNGRTGVYWGGHGPNQRRTALQCIRCGACMNHCPVYTRVGGHAYGTVYPGPIGKVLSPQLECGPDAAELPGASTLCGACAEICPVKIPLPDLLVDLRKDAAAGTGAIPENLKKPSLGESLAWRAWSWAASHPRIYALLVRLARLVPPPNLGPAKRWNAVRTPLVPSRRSVRDLLRGRDDV